MRRSWPANLIATIVIVATLGVGALGALGSPKAEGDAGRTSRGPAGSAVPACTGRFTSGPIRFDCPAGWFVWQNSSYPHDAYPSSLVVISNHRPLASGSEGLPDGWFKVDMYVLQRDRTMTFERLARDGCTSSGDTTLQSCTAVTIAGRRWMQRIETDSLTRYRSITTVVNGVEVQVVAMIPDGPHAADGARVVEKLFASLSLR